MCDGGGGVLFYRNIYAIWSSADSGMPHNDGLDDCIYTVFVFAFDSCCTISRTKPLCVYPIDFVQLHIDDEIYMHIPSSYSIYNSPNQAYNLNCKVGNHTIYAHLNAQIGHPAKIANIWSLVHALNVLPWMVWVVLGCSRNKLRSLAYISVLYKYLTTNKHWFKEIPVDCIYYNCLQRPVADK